MLFSSFNDYEKNRLTSFTKPINIVIKLIICDGEMETHTDCLIFYSGPSVVSLFFFVIIVKAYNLIGEKDVTFHLK